MASLYSDGELGATPLSTMKLLPVSVVEDHEAPKVEPEEVRSGSCGSIHIELPGEIRISLEGEVDPAMIRTVLKSLRS